MKKISLVALMSMLLAACTAEVYSNKGNASIIDSKDLAGNVVELTIQKDNGEVVKMTREYDAHASVGARIDISDQYDHQNPDLKTIRRYEFK